MTTPAIAAPRNGRWLSTLVLLLAGSASALLLWSRRDYVPIFDGRIYADCIQQAAANPGYLGGYRCAGHIAESYIAILAFAARLVPHTPATLLVANALLLLVGAVALWRLARSAFPGEEHRIGRALIVGAFLVHPIVLAGLVQPGLDFGLLVFSLCALAAAIEGRRWALVSFGIALVFSNEPGVVLYGVIAAAWLWRACAPHLSSGVPRRLGVATLGLLTLLALGARAPMSLMFFGIVLALVVFAPKPPVRPGRRGLVRAIGAAWPLVIPVGVLFAYLIAHKLHAAPVAAAGSSPPGAVWGKVSPFELIFVLLRPGMFDLPTRSTFALMLVTGFLWIPTVVLLLDLAVGTVRRARGLAPRELEGADASIASQLALVLVADAWLLSRFTTYANARYYLPVYPLVLVVTYGALVRLRMAARWRVAVMGTLAALLAISVIRTVDPVSRALWGTWRMGERSLLSITSITGECCGHGRDQLAYNLEFTELAALQDSLYERLRPTADSVLIVPWMSDWHTVDLVDGTTHHRTLREQGSVQPIVLAADSAIIKRVAQPTAWYIELPFATDTVFRDQLATKYDFGEPCYVKRHGYALAMRELRLRSSTATRPSIATRPATDIAGASPCSPPESALSVH
jgi:hypothetical protein